MTHGEGRNSKRVKDGALTIFRPTGQAAPERHQYARESRDSSEHAIEKSDTGVNSHAPSGHRRHFRTKECVEAVEHEKYADAGLDVRRFRPAENGNAGRYANYGSSEVRPELAPAESVLQ